MSDFTKGFKFGFLSQMYNNTFGGFAPFRGGYGCFRGFGNIFGGFGCFGGGYPAFGRGNIFSGCSGFNMFNVVPNPTVSIFNSYPSTSMPSMPVIQDISIPKINTSEVNIPTTGFSFNFPTISTKNMDFSNTNPTTDVSKKSTPSTEKYSDADTSYFSYDAKSLKEKWAKKKPNLKLSQEFFNKVVQIAQRVECDPNDLMGVMNIESNQTFRADVTNPHSGAVGLIQFMPKYVSSYGTSVEALKKMTPEEQLNYVEKYLIKNKKSAGIKGKVDAGQLYALIFTPAYAKQEVLARKGDAAYNSNPLLDKDKDNKITQSDLRAYVKEYRA